ncbi:MAG: alpha/beta hydrolase [Clostridia bacterium]|nr:alpha/beta hydrolase [Clostridia bacterium]
MIYNETVIEVHGHSAKLRAYIPLEAPACAYKSKRPAVLILPGGAYSITYEGEAEPVALKLCAEGICSFVLNYATFPDKQTFPIALAEAFSAMKFIRDNAREYGIDENNISVLGFSAGGHLCSCVGTLLYEDCLTPYLSEKREDYRANKMILCYPVISTNEKIAHKGSFQNLLGKAFDKMNDGERELLSTDKKVGKHTPPTFIWTTAEDSSVPAQNSLDMARALADNGIPFELYVYPHGNHGLCTADHTSVQRHFGDTLECSEWMSKAVRFIYDKK